MRAGEDPTPAEDDKKAAKEANKKARDDAWKRMKDLLKKIS
jgi:hypothetical protein